MGNLSRETIQRLYVLALVGSMPDGVWGSVRLQKMNFFAERDSEVRPFPVRRGPYGQYSEELVSTVEQLLAAKAILLTVRFSSEPGGQLGPNEYRLADDGMHATALTVLREVAPQLLSGLDEARRCGLLPQDELLREAYRHFNPNLEYGNEILPAYSPEHFEVESLSDEDCGDLEMALDPGFVQAMLKLADGFAGSRIDRSRVRTIGDLRALAARDSS